MQALTYMAYGPKENLVLRNVRDPVAKRGQLVVEVNYAALNPKDAIFRKGKFSILSGRSFPKYCGCDYSGIVKESNSTYFSRGDRVFGALNEWTFSRGTLAEQVVVSEQEAAKINEGVDEKDAACIGLVGLTALQALRDIACVEPGATVLIHGASGGVGTVAIQIAKILGARVVTTSSETNFELCKSLGADITLDYSKHPENELRGQVDVLFDVFGNLSVRSIVSVFRERGVFVSTVPSAKRALLELVTRKKRIQERLVVVKPKRADLELLGGWLQKGQLRAVVDSQYSMNDVHEAFARLESKRAKGKILVTLR